MIYLLLCIACYTAWAVLGKVTAGRLSVVEATFWYCAGQTLVMMFLGACTDSIYRFNKFFDVAIAILYGIIGAVGIFAFTGALRWRPASFVLPVVNVSYQALALLVFVSMFNESLTAKQVVGLVLMVFATGLLV